MDNYFKYLTYNPDDENWGLYLMVAGAAKIKPYMPYPPGGHPSGYNFFWKNGRVLQEYQINYITEGEGILETRKARYNIKAGSVILIHPNVWHRYRPNSETGWFEHYIGFRGDMAEKIIRSSDTLKEMSITQIGFHESVLRDFNEILTEVTKERPGYHQVCSGLVLHILGQIISINKNLNFRHTRIEETIQKACLFIRENLQENINIKGIASDLKVDYSVFRKAFKKYTGLSPMQYHTSLRLKQALILLTNSDMSMKEISSNLGFCSQYYFSKLFSEKFKKTPTAFRKEYSAR
jgi:AraC-like DNA-binding protein